MVLDVDQFKFLETWEKIFAYLPKYEGLSKHQSNPERNKAKPLIVNKKGLEAQFMIFDILASLQGINESTRLEFILKAAEDCIGCGHYKAGNYLAQLALNEYDAPQNRKFTIYPIFTC